MSSASDVPKHLVEQIRAELDAGEVIDWIDQPVPHYFNIGSIAVFLFAIPWTAFSIFWMIMASGALLNEFSLFSISFPLFGVPFVLIGLGMLLTPYWNYRKCLKTVYAITNRRALTIEGGRSSTIRSYTPDKLQHVYRKDRSNGTGDVIIEHEKWRDSDGDARSKSLGFLHIRKAKEIEDRLKRLAALDHLPKPVAPVA